MAAPAMEMEIVAETEQQQQQHDADHGTANGCQVGASRLWLTLGLN